MRSGDCFIIVYSVTDRRSFEEAQSIYEFTKRIRDTDMPVVRYPSPYFSLHFLCESPLIPPATLCLQVVCGNKCDLQSQREVATQEGVAYADKIGRPFFETSAKLRINIDEAIHELIRR